MTTWVVVDVSASISFGTGDRLKPDVSEGVARVVARARPAAGGELALLTFGGAGPDAARAPRRQPRRDRPAGALAAGVSPDGHADPEAFSKALRRLTRLARKPGLVVVVSDFREPDGWQRWLKALAARNEVVCVEVIDPREVELPDVGTVMMVDPETGRHLEADLSSPKLRQAFKTAEQARALKLKADVRRCGARHVSLWSTGDWLRGLGAGVARSRAHDSLQGPVAAGGAGAAPLPVLCTRAALRPRYAIRFPPSARWRP